MKVSANIYNPLFSTLSIIFLIAVWSMLFLDCTNGITYDDGFMLYELSKAHDTETSLSLWAEFLQFFPIDTFYELRIYGFGLTLLSFILLGVSLVIYQIRQGFDCHRIIFNIFVLGISYSFGLISIGYYSVQIFFFSLLLSITILSTLTSQNRIHYLIFYCWGIFSVFSFFTIPTSGTFVSGLIFLYLCYSTFSNWRKLLVELLAAFLGAITSILIISFIIAPIWDIVNNVFNKGVGLAQSGRGYSPFSMLKRVVKFLIELAVYSGIFVGLYWILAKTLSKKPFIYQTMFVVIFMVLLWLLPLDNYFRRILIYSVPLLMLFVPGPVNLKIRLQQLNPHKILLVLLAVLPIIATIGSNSKTAFTLQNYLFIWAVLYTLTNHNMYTRTMFLCASLIFIVFSRAYVFDSIQTKVKSDHPMLSHMYVQPTQIDYFNRVDSVFSAHGYESQKSMVWATGYDLNTTLLFDSKVYANYVQAISYLNYDFDNFPKADFIFYSAVDSLAIDEKFKEIGWNLDTDYDKYFLGNDDPTSYACDRYLYCRKK